jgi:hypothetical protein
MEISSLGGPILSVTGLNRRNGGGTAIFELLINFEGDEVAGSLPQWPRGRKRFTRAL